MKKVLSGLPRANPPVPVAAVPVSSDLAAEPEAVVPPSEPAVQPVPVVPAEVPAPAAPVQQSIVLPRVG